MNTEFGGKPRAASIDLAEVADFELGGLHVSPARREVSMDGQRRDVEPRVMQVLVALASAAPNVVSRDRLIERCWDGRIVGDDAINRCIVALRQLAREFSPEPFAVETVPRVGYSLVERPASQAATAAKPAVVQGAPSISSPPRAYALGARYWPAAAIALILVLIGTFSLFSPERTAPPAPAGSIAVAVLPFTNLSSEPEQEFFSDGITEEITAALARIPNLQVVARSSAFAFKGRKTDVKGIAEALHATHLIDGSVRRDGDQLRITAQLIEVNSGLQIWTNSYDRQLVNVLAIQEEIAHSVAGALRVPLGLAPGKTLLSQYAIDPLDYEQFLRAKVLVQGRQVREAVAVLEPIVARHPGFAPAWGELALAYQRVPVIPRPTEERSVEQKRQDTQEWVSKAEAAAQRAIALDPTLPAGYSSLALGLVVRGQLVRADELFAKALELDPFYPEALHTYSLLLGAAGRTGEAVAIKERVLNMEPFVVVYGGGLPDLLWTSGRVDDAVARLEPFGQLADYAHLAAVYWWQGRRGDAFDVLMKLPPGFYPAGMVDSALRFLRNGPAEADAARSLPRLGHRLDFAYFPAGVPERALERFEDDLAAGFLPPNLFLAVWTPLYAPLRPTERFKTLVRDAGLVEYWRAKGWPSFCRPTDGDDFICN